MTPTKAEREPGDSAVITARVPRALYERVVELGAREERTLSWLVNKALELYLARQPKKGRKSV